MGKQHLRFIFTPYSHFAPSSLLPKQPKSNLHPSLQPPFSTLSKMATPLLRPQTLGLGLGLSFLTHQTLTQRPYRMDTSPLSSSSGGSILSGDSYARNAKVPVVREGRLNESAVRQISSGSIIGVQVCPSQSCIKSSVTYD